MLVKAEAVAQAVPMLKAQLYAALLMFTPVMSTIGSMQILERE